MTPADIDRVFGYGRLKMVTGQHVEVYREDARAGERRRYTKRFLSTMDGDFREWTEREWRILARLVGHGVACVPEVVQFDRGAGGGTALVQTYDAGVTVDQWATLLPVERDGQALAHVFADCAHWWALANHGLIALDAIHRLEVIHLDIKADNVCIPFGPPHFRPEAPRAALQPLFHRLALIDFAFSLVAGEALATPLPIGRQQDYAYQSPRLLEALEAGRRGDLAPTRRLDWRCDLYSIAAMLARYLPPDANLSMPEQAPGSWTPARRTAAEALIERIRHFHDIEPTAERPHAELIGLSGEPLRESDLAASLDREWTLARDAGPTASGSRPTPVTRIAPAVRAPDFVAPISTMTTPVVLAGVAPPRAAEAASARASAEATAIAPLAGWHATTSAKKASQLSPVEPPPQPLPPFQRPLPSAAPAPVQLPVEPPSPPVDHPSAAALGTWNRTSQTAGVGAGNLPAPSAAGPAGGPAPVETASRIGSGSAVTAEPAFAANLQRFAVPGAVAGLLAVIVIALASGGWAALRRYVAPAAPVRTATAPAATASTRAPDAVAPPVEAASEPAAPVPVASDFSERSLQLLAGPVRELAGRAEQALTPALSLAERAQAAADDAAVRQAVVSAQMPRLDAAYARSRAPEDARRLNEQARNAFWTRRSVHEAFDLQMRAFGANPLDPEIAGNLAYFHLKANPPQPETARQLALHALAMRGPNFPAGRWEDWTTFAVASAMTGRDADARRAFWLTLAVTDKVEKNCRAALNAAASYGPRVRPPAEAVLARVNSRGSSGASPYCAWPPNWAAGTRFP